MSLVSLILATDEGGLIGRNNQLPWHMPGDLKFFKKVTTGHSIIMGRKTFESIGKPLPDRKSIVITRQNSYKVPPGVLLAPGIKEALDIVRDENEVFVIGGSEIFRSSAPYADRIYLTLIHHRFEGDTWFDLPAPDSWKWNKTSAFPADEKNPYPYSIWVLDKKS